MDKPFFDSLTRNGDECAIVVSTHAHTRLLAAAKDAVTALRLLGVTDEARKVAHELDGAFHEVLGGSTVLWIKDIALAPAQPGKEKE